MYDSTDLRHLILVSDAIKRLDKHDLALLNANLSHCSLMNTHWWVKACVWLIKTFHGIDGAHAWFELYSRAEIISLSARDQTIAHMLHGKDLHDPNSAGGFSQTEVSFIEDMLMMSDVQMEDPSAHMKDHIGLDAAE